MSLIITHFETYHNRNSFNFSLDGRSFPLYNHNVDTSQAPGRKGAFFQEMYSSGRKRSHSKCDRSARARGFDSHHLRYQKNRVTVHPGSARKPRERDSEVKNPATMQVSGFYFYLSGNNLWRYRMTLENKLGLTIFFSVFLSCICQYR